MNTTILVIASIVLTIAPGAPVLAQARRQAPPLIASVEPARVPHTGGTRVVIAGEGFRPGVVVRLCDEVIKDATWVTPNQVEFLSPPREPGACDLTVQNPDGQIARIRTVFAFSDAPAGVMVGSLGTPSIGLRPPVLGAPLPPAAVSPGGGAMRPAPSAARPAGPQSDEVGPDRVAAEFMALLVRKEDTGRLHHPRMRSPVSPGVVFGYAFSDAFPGVLVGTPIVHFEGRMESINLQGERVWLPFVLHVTQERPARVTGFAISANPAGSRDSLVRAIEQHVGSDVVLDLERPLRPLP